MPRYSSSTAPILFFPGTWAMASGSASAAESVTVMCEPNERATPRTAVLRGDAFSYSDVEALEQMRIQAGDDTIGRPARPPRRIAIEE